MKPDADIVVAGGGPAGLAVAIRAREQGLRVLVIDARRPVIDKACGEGLMPEGAALLDRLGVRIPPDRCRRFRGIRWIGQESEVEADFPDRPGLGVRRTDLHHALLARAEDLGAELRWGIRVGALSDGALVTSGGTVRGRWLVAADGLRSPLRSAAGLAGPRARRARFGLTRHYAVDPWTDHVEVYWSGGAEAYVTPVGPREVGVAILYEGLRPDHDALLARFPRLAERLAWAPAVSAPRGAGPLEQRVTSVVRGNVALVGDAAGYVDAITGEGLSLAFGDAFAVVDAIVRGDLTRYAAAHRRARRAPEMLTRALLALEWRPAVMRRVLHVLARNPALFRGILALHVRARALAPTGLRTASHRGRTSDLSP